MPGPPQGQKRRSKGEPGWGRACGVSRSLCVCPSSPRCAFLPLLICQHHCLPGSELVKQELQMRQFSGVHALKGGIRNVKAADVQSRTFPGRVLPGPSPSPHPQVDQDPGPPSLPAPPTARAALQPGFHLVQVSVFVLRGPGPIPEPQVHLER